MVVTVIFLNNKIKVDMNFLSNRHCYYVCALIFLMLGTTINASSASSQLALSEEKKAEFGGGACIEVDPQDPRKVVLTLFDINGQQREFTLQEYQNRVFKSLGLVLQAFRSQESFIAANMAKAENCDDEQGSLRMLIAQQNGRAETALFGTELASLVINFMRLETPADQVKNELLRSYESELLAEVSQAASFGADLALGYQAQYPEAAATDPLILSFLGAAQKPSAPEIKIPELMAHSAQNVAQQPVVPESSSLKTLAKSPPLVAPAVIQEPQ